MSEPEARGTQNARPERAHFHPLFERWARRVRGRLALRHALTGAALGLAIATLPAALAWKTRHGVLRPYAPLVGAAGAIVGLVAARRKRWTDTDVALYLDERLATEEAIATAVELRNESELEDPARAVVVTSAAEALEAGDTAKARPRLWKPVHALAPLAVGALVLIARAPLPAPPLVIEPPGTTKVQLIEVEGLDKSIKLAALDARDAAQKERLDKIAKDAEKLKEQLKEGMQKRDAQDKIARLRDAIAAERLSLGDGEKRAGLESAVAKLEEHDATKAAAKALGDHDLETMDAQMEKLANDREAADREAAKQALDDAAGAAAKGGAPDVAKALEEEKRLTDKRGKRADTLRDLAKGMHASGTESSDVASESEALDREGTDKAAEKLADAMGKALGKLTPEERKRLAEKLRQEAAAKGTTKADSESLKDLASDLSTPEGQKQLEDQLKDMAKDDTESDESKRQKELDEAQEGAAGTEGDIGKQGQQGQKGQGQQGQQGQGQHGQQGQQGQQGQGQQGQGQGEGQGQGAIPIPGSGGDGTGGPGSHHDTGTGSHVGKTDVLDAQTLKSRAKGPLNKGGAMPGSITTYTPGKAGGTANTRGTGDLRVVGPGEVDGVERSDIPEEYRDHVRQYFQP